jgi:hypothetical protein
MSHLGCPIGEPSRVVKVPAMRPAQNQGVKMPKYLFLQRSVPAKREPPSPAQMQDMYAAFNAWKEKFKENILDMGGQLTPGGKVVTTSGATDGPFVEAKEIVGGYMLVSAESFDRALEVARESPGVLMPGSSVEIREIREMAGS